MVARTTFSPGQEGFDSENPTTWSKKFRNSALDILWDERVKIFEVLFEAHSAIGLAMLEGFKETKPRSFRVMVKKAIEARESAKKEINGEEKVTSEV